MATINMTGLLYRAFICMANKNPPPIKLPLPDVDQFIRTSIDPARKGPRLQPKGRDCETTLINLRRKKVSKLNLRKGYFIDDEEIHAVIMRPEEFNRASPQSPETPYGRPPFMRAVLQQLGTRGCVAACSAMICLDHRIIPDWSWLQTSDLDDDRELENCLSEKGFQIKKNPISLDAAAAGNELDHLMRICYAGILSINGELGRHVVMLDYFSLSSNLAIMRDPFHGWCIATSASSVLHRYPESIIAATLP